MPPKKKLRLSTKSADAVKSQLARSRESDEDRQRRLAAQRERDAYRRQHETPEQRRSRLAANAARTARARAQARTRARSQKIPTSGSARPVRNAARSANRLQTFHKRPRSKHRVTQYFCLSLIHI